jgi:4-hydroxythreonine-4-phosphate dehydrogenase
MDTFVFTCGDINGIGPEIVIKSLNKITRSESSYKYFLVFPENVFHNVTKKIKPKFSFDFISDLREFSSKSGTHVTIFLLPAFRLNIGNPTKESGKASYLSLETSFSFLQKGIADAVVTAPVSKTALHFAGVKFPGQTEMYAHWSGSKNYVMTFLSDKLNVCLYTIHVPLNKVSNLLNNKILRIKLNTILNMLNKDLGIKKPSIAVLGLNPHAGEGGIIGTEERDKIIPVLKSFSSKHKIDGPFSADAFFANRLYKNYNMVLGMYHDQVLIPFKHINFGGGVNYTAGLPIIRTSPDHGVAYDIAGKYKADESSMIQAYKYAKLILHNRRRHE